MNTELPTGKLGRTLAGGRMAAKVGGKVLTYYAKRPFLSRAERSKARENTALESARSLFQGLSLLKGTALKMAQQLSLEMDLLPEAVCQELAKSYHQVPPINRGLVRKILHSALGCSPESAFARFDTRAFAAASLGQVHRAQDKSGQQLAVKLQYPGIAKTIRSDVGLLRGMLAPFVESDQLRPALDEIAARLNEEVDYLKEAENLCYFTEHLNLEGIRIPRVHGDLSGATVLTTTLMPGKPLDLWLRDNPAQADRDQVARRLNALVVKGLYELRVIHADPNPGNFIIADDLTIGLVDFGCIKRFSSDFVERYRRLALAAAHSDDEAHFRLILKLGLVSPDLDETAFGQIRELSVTIRQWFGRLFAEPVFDFSSHPGFMGEGQAVMRQYHHLRRHFRVNPDLIFLDRTRYGLLRIFEMLGARVALRNPYEW
jgi:predicted unusual protein kinase regulating ubiquinone biosynthesis (AarF/ABC1/UbiB family)